MGFARYWPGLMVLAALVTGAASAQTKATTPAPVGSEPGSTTASYGDWILRCDNAASPDGQKHICEVVQTMQVQGQQAPLAQIVIARTESSGNLRVVVALPVNVVFPSAVKIVVDDKDPRPLELTWRKCVPGACLADAIFASDTIGRLRSSTTPGRIQFTDAAGKPVAIPLSFRGMAQALDALQKQP